MRVLVTGAVGFIGFHVKKGIRRIGTLLSRGVIDANCMPARLTASCFQAAHTTDCTTTRYTCSWFDILFRPRCTF